MAAGLGHGIAPGDGRRRAQGKSYMQGHIGVGWGMSPRPGGSGYRHHFGGNQGDNSPVCVAAQSPLCWLFVPATQKAQLETEIFGTASGGDGGSRCVHLPRFFFFPPSKTCPCCCGQMC